MTFFAALLMVLLGPSFYLALCCLWASWMAVGRTPLIFRMPIFLAGTLPLGLAFCVYHSSASFGVVFGFMFVLMPAMACGTGQWRYGLGGLVWFLLGIYWVMSNSFYVRLDMYYFCTVPLGLCCLAVLISVLRTIGFRLIRLSSSATDQHLDLATGKNFNEWIRHLDDQGASAWTFAEIMAQLRSFGIEYQIQKAIAVAYEQSLGRRSVDDSSDGRAQLIAEDSMFSGRYWRDRWGQTRFTVAQTLCWSVAAASLFAFFRYFSSVELTTNAILVGGPFLIVMAVISLGLLQAVLGVRGRIGQVSPPLVIAMLAVLMLPMAIGNYGLGIVGVWANYFALLVGVMAGATGWMTAGLILIRGQGYRLVRVQTTCL